MSCQRHMQRSASRHSGVRRGERGLTLIELMVGLVVASILVGFVFDIHNRMSRAYRSQTSIGALQQGLRAASAIIAHNARSAGFMMPDGMRVSSEFTGDPLVTPGLVTNDGESNIVPALLVRNNPDGMPGSRMQPDQIHVFYADAYARAVVADVSPTPNALTVDDDDNFETGDLVLFVNGPEYTPHGLGDDYPDVVTYNTCLVKLTAVGPGTLSFAPSPPYNTAANEHCFIPGKEAIKDKAMVYRLAARAFRIDTNNAALGELQMSPSGGLQGDDWQTMGIGFVDMQISQRYVQVLDDTIDQDGDGNTRMEWYSTAAPTPPEAYRLNQIGIAMVSRTIRPVDGVGSSDVPVLTGGNPIHNPWGDAGGPKDTSQPEYQGNHVYRTASTIVDTRNLGIAY